MSAKTKRPRKLRWFSISMATWNIGPARKSQDLVNLMLITALIFLQEASDKRPFILSAVKDRGWGYITGDQPGQSATPLVYDKDRLELIQADRVLVAHSQNVGPGAGPSTLKEKWLIGGLFRDRHTGRTFWAYSVHYVATQGTKLRRRAALATSNRILIRLRSLKRAVFIGGDYNAVISSKVIRMLLAFPLSRTADVETEKNRGIDRILFSVRTWIKLKETVTVENGSDHKAVVANFEFKERRRQAA